MPRQEPQRAAIIKPRSAQIRAPGEIFWVCITDNVTESARRFDGFQDLDELAVGTGFGLRYDFGLFLLRLDMGFKTHNPVLPKGSRWNFNYQLKNANPTLGINYPF